MKRLLLTCTAATALVVAGCIDIDLSNSAHAIDGGQVTLTGGDISTTLSASEGARVAGADVTLRGSVRDKLDVSAADFVAYDMSVGALDARAADIRFSGQVSGDVSLQAADVQWSGPIGGAFNASSADLDFEGVVEGPFTARSADLVLSGRFSSLDLAVADVDVSRDALVMGDVRADAARFKLDGEIDGELDLQARTVFLNGIVTGPLSLEVDPGRGRLDRLDGLVEINGQVAGGSICARRVVIAGEVAGPLSVTADAAPEIQSGGQADITFTPRGDARCER